MGQGERDEDVRVLIVDDHTVMRKGLTSLLDDEEGIRVVGTAASGEEGIERARQLRPDVILMDVSMPGMSGAEATRAIKDELPQTRVIGLSMHDLDGTREHMLACGAEVYLTKDGPLADLLAAIRGTGPDGAMRR